MSKATLQELDRLEARICRGLGAFQRRNELIIELVADGWSQVDVARRLNKVRAGLGAPQITPDAIAATIKRLSKEKPNE